MYAELQPDQACVAACTVTGQHTLLDIVKVTKKAVSVTCLRLQLVPPVVHKGLESSVNMSRHDTDIVIMHHDHDFKIMTRHTMICTANSRPFSLCLLQNMVNTLITHVSRTSWPRQ